MAHAAVAEDQILKVHRAGDGSIWFVEGARRAARSPLGLHDFPDGPEVSRAARVRLLGTWDNAPLVARLYAFKHLGRLGSVAVASPMLGQTRAERGDPALMLARMRACAWPASLGGYHEVTRADYLAYLLATYFQFDLADPERVDPVLVEHPAWRYVSFVPHLDRMKVARLLALILDPRWYARWGEATDDGDPRDYVAAPAREAARLNQFLGLDPRTLAGPTPGEDPARGYRARTALAAWKTTEAPPRAALGADPRYFLWRRWRAYDSAAKADLRVTQLFVDFFRQCWLDSIYQAAVRRTPAGRPDGLFAPDHFFSGPDAAAFRDHLAGA